MVAFKYDILKLAERIAHLGLTELAVAKRAKVHPSTVHNVLTGSTCKAPTIKKICEAVGLELREITLRVENNAAGGGR